VVLLRQALTDARTEGYTVAGFSGGEPLLYASLREVLSHARGLDMLTTVTSNGTLLDSRRLAAIADVTSLLAISLDGVRESHDRVRGLRAFARMEKHLEAVGRCGIPFGFIFTLTQHNVDQLEPLAKFALEHGAKLLQIHPLEMLGRAATLMRGQRPDAIEASVAYIEAARIQQEYGGQLLVHIDLFDRDLLRQVPESVLAATGPQPWDAPLAELVSPLVVEPDATVVPIRYGFGRAYALGNLLHAPLSELSRQWRRNRLRSFRALCRRLHRRVTVPTVLPFFNWYEAIGAASLRRGSTTLASAGR